MLDVKDPAEDGTVKYIWHHHGLALFSPEVAEGGPDYNWCKTEPQILLRADEHSPSKFTIMILEEECVASNTSKASTSVEPYTFDIEAIHSIPIPCSISK